MQNILSKRRKGAAKAIAKAASQPLFRIYTGFVDDTPVETPQSHLSEPSALGSTIEDIISGMQVEDLELEEGDLPPSPSGAANITTATDPKPKKKKKRKKKGNLVSLFCHTQGS